MNRSLFCYVLTGIFVAFLFGCGDDGGGVVTTTDTDGGTGDPTTTTSTSTSTSTSTTSTTGDPESDGVGPCRPVIDGAGSFSVASPSTPHPRVNLDAVCNDDLLDVVGIAHDEPEGHEILRVTGNPNAIDDDSFDVLVYGPDVVTPIEDPLPLFVFVPGADQFSYHRNSSTEGYADLAASVVEDGYVAMFINPKAEHGNHSSGKRWRMQLCTLVWAATSGLDGWEPPRDGQGNPLYTLSGQVVLAGHSRGGGATLHFAKQFEGFKQSVSLMQDYELCGVVSVAPIWAPGDGFGDWTDTHITLSDDEAVPWLVLAGAYDEDTRAGGLKQFDALVPEDELTLSRSASCGGPSSPAGCSDFNTWDKVMALSYGTTHNAWGGSTLNTSPESIVRGEAVGPALVRAFLRWQMTGIDVQGSRDLFALLMNPDATNGDFPGGLDLADPALWDTHPQYTQLPMNEKRPLVFASHRPGIGPANVQRIVIDPLARTGSLMCGGDGTGRPADFLSPSLHGGDVIITGLGVSGGVASDQVCQGGVNDLSANTPGHETEALRVLYGGSGSDPGGAIRWDFSDNPIDAGGYHYLNVRVGNFYQGGGCSLADNLDGIEIEIETQDTNMVVVPFDRPSGPHVGQQGELPPMETGVLCVDGVTQAMYQYRFALSDFCPVGVPMNMSEITGITVRFPAGQEDPQGVLIDSIELTRSDLEPEGAACPALASAWNCPATGRLLVREVSCEGEPSPTCASGDVVLTNVDKPWVDNPGGGGFEGWVVHAPNIEDPLNPSSSELAYVQDRCVEACTLEYSDRPDIVTSCSQSLAWDTPTLRGVPSLPTVRRIPLARRDGSGAFTGLSLSSDLLVDACHAFDEDLCAATPARVTPARISPSGAPLGRGEEWRAQLGGSSELVLTTPGDSDGASLTGVVGWSGCTDFSGSSLDCPFYLGSLELETIASIGLSDTCPDSSTFMANVSDFSLSLHQPAFGIADTANASAGFPPGALVLEARLTIGGADHFVRGFNEEDVIVDLITGGPEGEVSFGFDVPCGTGTLPITADLVWVTSSILDSPPSIAITMPDYVWCGTSAPPVTLSASASDPDSDLLETRWFADDVLLEASMTEMQFTGGHVMRAVARDARGATTTATKTIECIPVAP